MQSSQLKCLFRRWGHSREEDGEGIFVYRPAGYPFPLARGRDWMEFRADGTVIFFGAAPDDRSRAETASWTIAEDDSLRVQRESAGGPQRLTIIDCSESILKLRWD